MQFLAAVTRVGPIDRRWRNPDNTRQIGFEAGQPMTGVEMIPAMADGGTATIVTGSPLSARFCC